MQTIKNLLATIGLTVVANLGTPVVYPTVAEIATVRAMWRMK